MKQERVSDTKNEPVKFADIMEDNNYFEITESGKRFFICNTEGYIPVSKIDREQTKFLDLHCKCGQHVIAEEFSSHELLDMEHCQERKYFRAD